MPRANDYLKLRRGKYRLLVHKDFAESQLDIHLAGGIDELRKHYELIHVPSSDTALVYKFNFGNDTFYYKQHMFRDWRDVVKHIFRPNRSMRAMKGGLLLQKHGFEAPEIVAIGYRSLGPLQFSSFTLTRQVAALNIYQYWERLKTDKNVSSKKKLIEAFGTITGQMHAQRIKHGDLRLGNVLVYQTGDRYRFVFLDNERTNRFLSSSARERLKNLVQINMFREQITNTDRLRFFTMYLKMCPSNDKNKRSLITKIEQATSRRLAKKAKL